MNEQLELMFDLLQQEVEQLAADLAREDSGNSNIKKLDTISEISSLDSLIIESELERSLKNKTSSNSITGLNHSNSPLQPSTISTISNSHQRSASHIEARNLSTTSIHQKSKSVDSRYIVSELRDTNYLSPLDSNTPSPTQLSPTSYQRIRTLSNSSNISDTAVPILSPMLSPRTNAHLILSSDSDSDVSVSSSDDTSGSDSDDSPLMGISPNLLRSKTLKDLPNVQNSSVNDQNSTISNENNYTTSSSKGSRLSRDPSITKKTIKRSPTTGHGLNKSINSSVIETSSNSYYTDDENRPLRFSSKIQDFNLEKQREVKQTVRPRRNSRAQELKHVIETSTSKSYDADDENRPLRPKANSQAQDIILDKPIVRPRANSRAQELNLDLYLKDSSIKTPRNRNSIDQIHRRSGSKEGTSDDLTETSKSFNSKEHIERSKSMERNSKDYKNFQIRSNKLREPEYVRGTSKSSEKVSDDHEGRERQMHSQDYGIDFKGIAKSKSREVIELSQDMDSQKHSGARPKTREPEDKEQIRPKIENLPEEDRGRESHKNIEQDNDRGRVRSKIREEERERARSKVRGEEERERTRSKVRGEEERERARSKVRGEEDRERARSKVRGEEDRGRARSKVRGEEDRGRARSKVRGEEDRGRARSKVRGEEDHGRAKSKVRGEEDRGRVRSSPKELEESSGRAKSRTRENDNKEPTRSRTRGRDYELLDKEKHSRRREKAEAHIEKEEQKITEIKLTTQIFIENANQYRTLSITSTRTALDILNYFRNNKIIADSESWTLFEVINEFGLERPLRDWEYVATVIGNWELNKQNAIVLKKYTNRNCLTIEGFNNAVPPMFGSLHLEIKKNKWQKRHVFIRDGSVYHCKDAKGNNETFLCSLANFDVYTLTKMVKKPPTKFIFALKSQDKIAMFENPDDYVRYLCADHLDKMKDWVLSLRAAKNNLLRTEYPERFENPIKSEKTSVLDNNKLYSEKSLIGENSTELNAHNDKAMEKRRSINQWENLRKHVRNSRSLYVKSEDNSLGLISNSGFKKKEPSSGIKEPLNNTTISGGDQPFKEGSLLDISEKNQPSKQVEPEVAQFVKGSLLASNDALFEEARERDKLRKAMGGVGIIRDPNSSTFINLNNSVKFNQGSLLNRSNDTTIEHNNHSSNSPTSRLVQIENGVESDVAHFAKGSLLASNDALFEEAREREKLRKAMGGVGIVRDPNSSTFINLNNSVKFNQGSLLDRNNDTTIEHNNNSNNSPTGRLVQIENGVQFNKGSLLTKKNTQKSPKNPSGTLLKIDTPLSRSATVQNILSPNGKTLLELDIKPDAAHTLALRNTNIKPLISFVPGEKDYNLGVKSPRNLGFNNNNDEESETDSEYDSDDE